MIKDDCGGIWLDWPHVITLFDSDGSERDYLPERTCRNDSDAHPSDEFLCSECGFCCEIVNKVRVDDTLEYDYFEYEPDYCPHCGAKVVKE